MYRRMFNTLYSKLLTFFMLVSTLPIIIVGYISYESEKDALTSQLEKNLFVLANNLAAETEYFIAERLKDVAFLAANPVLRNPESTRQDLETVLRDFEDSHKLYDGTVLVDTKGTAIVDTNNGVAGKNLAERGWFRPALQGNTYFSDIYFSPLVKRPLLVLAAPVKDRNGRITGVVSPSLNLSYLWRTVDHFTEQQKSMGLSGYAFILNSKGDIIAHPDRSKILFSNFLQANNLTTGDLTEFDRRKKLFYYYQQETVTAFAILNPVQNFNNDWFVAISVPETQLYLPLRELIIKHLITFGLVLLVTTLLAIYLARSLVKPIEQLVVAAADFGAGKKIPPLKVENSDELGKLISAFNAMVASLEDREQEKSLLEKELVRSEKLKVAGELAAGVAHEIRNPLTTIKGFLQLFDSRNLKDGSQEECFQIMIQELDRINEIITDFLTLAKPDYNKNISRTEVVKLIDEILILQQTQALVQNISVSRDYESLPAVYLDPNQLKQVFINIIRNAFEAMTSGGSLKVVTRFLAGENAVTIAFSDTGGGMDSETLDNLGTPFFTTKDNGTGIGMMLCYRIIENMQGTLTVESKINSGTTITIKLPVSE